MSYARSYADTRPDWIMLGVPRDDGTVMLLASKELTHAELRTEAERYDAPEDRYGFSRSIPGPITTTVTAGVREFVIVMAADYDAAFSNLRDHWQPRRTERTPIGDRAALPPAAPRALR